MADVCGEAFLGSKVELVGVRAVDTSETESFLIINCTGEPGDEFEFGGWGCISAAVGGIGVVSGGVGKSGIAERGAVLGMSVSELPEGFRRGMSSNFQSASVAPALEFFRRDRRDIFRVNTSVASFAIDEIDVFR